MRFLNHGWDRKDVLKYNFSPSFSRCAAACGNGVWRKCSVVAMDFHQRIHVSCDEDDATNVCLDVHEAWCSTPEHTHQHTHTPHHDKVFWWRTCIFSLCRAYHHDFTENDIGRKITYWTWSARPSDCDDQDFQFYFMIDYNSRALFANFLKLLDTCAATMNHCSLWYIDMAPTTCERFCRSSVPTTSASFSFHDRHEANAFHLKWSAAFDFD